MSMTTSAPLSNATVPSTSLTAEWRPIADYAFLSDCNSGALVDRSGSIDWLCLPRFDSDALFARLLDPTAGHWSLQPMGPFQSTRRYLPGTLVQEITFTTAEGKVRLTDALAFPPEQRVHDLGLDVPHELFRVVEGISGSVDLAMEFAPRPEFAQLSPAFEAHGFGCDVACGRGRVSLTAGVPVELKDHMIQSRFRLNQGETVGFSLRWRADGSPASQPVAPPEVAGRVADTVAAWRSWEEAHDIYQGSRRSLVRLSSRVLKGLAYRPTGAILAAPTTSLPEGVGGGRNWDYRFAWIRDASLTLEALYIGACSEEARHFITFLTEATGGHDHEDQPAQIMYGIGGERDLTERTLPHLRGWRDSQPVRVGNGAWNQTQLDVYGELLVAIHRYRERLGDLPPHVQHFVADIADSAARRWRERDAGMWEMRGAPQHHLSSKVLCWAALDRAIDLAPLLGAHAHVQQWSAERDRIETEVLTRGWSERRRAFAQSFDSDELDAAALLMPLVGFLPATDPRMRATIEAIARDLTEDGLVLRYRVEEGLNPDGLTGEEGTFVICSFWLVSCLALAGEQERAAALFDDLTGFANDLGLLAEEVDPTTGELLGNFPQAFSHIGLIVAAAHLDGAIAPLSGGPPGGGMASGMSRWPRWLRWPRRA